MKYTVTTTDITWGRTKNDDSSKLRIYNIGEYPVQVAVDNGSYCEPFYRNQYVDVNITATPIKIKSIGGSSIVRTYRVYGVNHDECDIEGYFDTTILSKDNVSSLIGQKAVLRDNVVQSISGNLSNSNVPSTQAVQNALDEISATIGTPIKYKGTVQTFDKLPTHNRLIGDMYNVVEPYGDYLGGTNFVWNGDVWDALGGTLEILPSAIKSFNDNYEAKTEAFNTSVRQAELDLDNLTSDKILSVDEKVNSVSDDIDEYKEFISTEAFKIADTVAQVQAAQRDVNAKAEEVDIAAKRIVDDVAEASKLRDELGDISTAVSTVTKAESNVKSLEDSAWLAVSRAEAISDPEGRLDSLQLDKEESGKFIFNKGKFQCKDKWDSAKPFSLVFTLKRPSSVYGGEDKKDRVDAVYTCNNVNAGRGFILSMDDRFIGFYYHWRDTDNTEQYFGRALEGKRYFDNKPHVWAYTFTGTSCSLSLDGEVIDTRPVANIVSVINTFPLTFELPKGEVSRVKVFDFDITTENGIYTLDDYISGKDEPKVLREKTEQLKINESNVTGSNYRIEGDKVYVLTGNTAYPSVFNNVLKKDYAYTIKYSTKFKFTNIVQQKIKLPTKEAVLHNLNTGYKYRVFAKDSVFYFKSKEGVNIVGNGEQLDFEISFIADIDANNDTSTLYIDYLDTTVDNWFSISVQKVGSMLLLSDYSYNNLISDMSENNNYATFFNGVYGTKDKIVDNVISNVETLPAVVSKSNRGELWFGGAGSSADIIKWDSFGISLPFSIAFRIRATDEQTGTLSYLFRLSNGIFIARQSGLRVEKYTSTNTKEKTLLAPTNIEAEIFDGNWHSIIVVCTTTTLSLYYEKGLIATATGNFTDIQPNLFRIGGGGASSGFGGQMADIKIFNFDMSSDDALYTIADYIAGKDEPPNSALLSLTDYTFDGEVLDNSGNGNHATVTGNVKGTNDVAVETLYSKFAARIQSLINK